MPNVYKQQGHPKNQSGDSRRQQRTISRNNDLFNRTQPSQVQFPTQSPSQFPSQASQVQVPNSPPEFSHFNLPRLYYSDQEQISYVEQIENRLAQGTAFQELLAAFNLVSMSREEMDKALTEYMDLKTTHMKLLIPYNIGYSHLQLHVMDFYTGRYKAVIDTHVQYLGFRYINAIYLRHKMKKALAKWYNYFNIRSSNPHYLEYSNPRSNGYLFNKFLLDTDIMIKSYSSESKL